MDFTKVQNLINKINNLFQSIKMTENQISVLERDLMKSYLRELYEVLDQDDSTDIRPSEQPQIIKEFPKAVIEDLQTKDADKHQINENSKLKPSIADPVDNSFDQNLDQSLDEVKNELKEIIKPPKIEPVADDNHIPDYIPSPNITSNKQDQPSEPEVTKVSTANVFNLDPEMAELFSEPSVSDLSDKLSVMPIGDLSKAFGVNERILTINELFGGNVHLFTNTIEAINNMHTFHEAKNYLVRKVAGDMKWTEESKKNKASSFIKTVRRKFK